MKAAIVNIFSLFRKKNPQLPKRTRKSKGQSLVEVAIALPVLIMLFSGLVEFGFALNYYLSLLDATRYAARWGSDQKPFTDTGADNIDNFYTPIAGLVLGQLEPNPQFVNGDTTKKIKLDSAADDVIVSVYSVSGSTVTSYPTSGPFQQYPGHLTSSFSADGSNGTKISIGDKLVNGAPNAGILIVEVYYNYHQVLALPWLTPFVPNPILLHAYTIMPLGAAEPTPIP